MEYKLILAQSTVGKSGADWVELQDEIEEKINRILVTINAFHIEACPRGSQLPVEQYKMIFIGGITTTYEKSKGPEDDATITLSQAILIPKEVSKYIKERDEQCFRF